MKKYKKNKFILGIDEVGRGALAGPVTIGAALLKTNLIKPKHLGVLKDSKKLTKKQRKKWFSFFERNKIDYIVVHVNSQQIDKINILNAVNLGVQKVFLKIIKKTKFTDFNNLKIFLDGGLYLKTDLVKSKNIKTLIKGDEKITAIKIASIIAKVVRDEYMIKLAKKYPQYLFYQHKGYGTKLHFNLIKKYGLSKVHRLTFCRNCFKI